MSAKILITGLANSGKSTLLKTLKDALVISRDGKKCSLPIMHKNMAPFDSIDDFIEEMYSVIDKYKQKTGAYPRTIAIDSVSCIGTEAEANNSRKFKGFDIWSNLNTEQNKLVSAIEDLTNISNVVIISHCVVDETSGRLSEVSKGSFGKKGGFLSTVDYALNIAVKGKKRTITHRNELARTLLDDMPDNQDVDTFNLQEYIEKIECHVGNVSTWSLD